jgi:hypothetical protein
LKFGNCSGIQTVKFSGLVIARFGMIRACCASGRAGMNISAYLRSRSMRARQAAAIYESAMHMLAIVEDVARMGRQALNWSDAGL